MNASELLGLVKRPVEKMTVAEWGEIYVRGLTVAEYDRVEIESAKAEVKQLLPGWLLRFGVVDAHGVHIFNDSHATELNNLPAKMGTTIERAIYRLSLATEKDLEKKSPATTD